MNFVIKRFLFCFFNHGSSFMLDGKKPPYECNVYLSMWQIAGNICRVLLCTMRFVAQ